MPVRRTSRDFNRSGCCYYGPRPGLPSRQLAPSPGRRLKCVRHRASGFSQPASQSGGEALNVAPLPAPYMTSTTAVTTVISSTIAGVGLVAAILFVDAVQQYGVALGWCADRFAMRRAGVRMANEAARHDRDVFRLAPSVDASVLNTIAARLEFRGTDERFSRLSQGYFARVPLASARRILALGSGLWYRYRGACAEEADSSGLRGRRN